jgi:hypothetical protein
LLDSDPVSDGLGSELTVVFLLRGLGVSFFAFAFTFTFTFTVSGGLLTLTVFDIVAAIIIVLSVVITRGLIVNSVIDHVSRGARGIVGENIAERHIQIFS